jgi:hypothetical protein
VPISTPIVAGNLSAVTEPVERALIGSLTGQLEQLKMLYDGVLTHGTNLQAQNAQLQAQIAQLQAQNAQLQARNTELAAAAAVSRKDRVDKILKTMHDLSSGNISMRSLLGVLNREIGSNGHHASMVDLTIIVKSLGRTIVTNKHGKPVIQAIAKPERKQRPIGTVPCKYDDRCKNPKCAFAHTDTTAASGGGGAAAPTTVEDDEMDAIQAVIEAGLPTGSTLGDEAAAQFAAEHGINDDSSDDDDDGSDDTSASSGGGASAE